MTDSEIIEAIWPELQKRGFQSLSVARDVRRCVTRFDTDYFGITMSVDVNTDDLDAAFLRPVVDVLVQHANQLDGVPHVVH